MSIINRIIFNSIDKTLDKLEFVNKKEFLSMLATKYEVRPFNIAERFGDFHTALKAIYGIDHLIVEREIINTMHRDTRMGKYHLVDEIEAFILMMNVFTKDTTDTLDIMRQRQEEIERRKR